MRRPLDVTLCGFYGFGNLGDELIAESLLDLLEKNGVSRDRVAVLSADRRAPGSREGVSMVERWSPLKVLKALRSSRTLLLGGGGLFQDSTSIRSCIYYWGVTRMAWLAGCKIWAFGQSVGPLRSGPAIYLARDALSICKARVVRDRGSMEYLEKWGLKGEIAPDPVLAMVPGFQRMGDGDLLLVNIRPWHGGLPETTALASVSVQERCRLEMIAVALSDEDESLMSDLRSRGMFSPSRIVRIGGIEEARSLWRRAKVAVGMRLHFCLLSALAGIPCLAVPYDPKVRFFAEDWGLPVWEGKLPSSFPGIGLNRSRIEEASERLQEVFSRVLGSLLAGE